jgi:hypothetical protein
MPFWILDFGLKQLNLGIGYLNLSIAIFFQIGVIHPLPQAPNYDKQKL